jgi:transposase
MPSKARQEGVLMVKKSARRTRCTHSPASKAQVALAALREDRTLADLANHVELYPAQIIEWTRQSSMQSAAMT